MVSFLPARWPRREPTAHQTLAPARSCAHARRRKTLPDFYGLGVFSGGVNWLCPPCPSRHTGQPRTRNQSTGKYARQLIGVKAQARFSGWLRFSASGGGDECVVVKRPVDPASKAQTACRSRLQPRLLSRQVRSPQQVQQPPADRGVGLEVEQLRLLIHLLVPAFRQATHIRGAFGWFTAGWVARLAHGRIALGIIDHGWRVRWKWWTTGRKAATMRSRRF
jgi:hypothetical protein